MRKDLRRAPEHQVLADIVAAAEAIRADLAGHADFKGDAVAYSQVRDRGADGGDDSGGLMAEHERSAYLEVAVAAMVVVVQVRAADAGCEDVDLGF